MLSFFSGDDSLVSMIDFENAVKYVLIHRSSIRKDIITLFSDPGSLNSEIQMQVLDERGRYEKGEGKGVVRDIITNFWQDCFTSLMVGSSEKIPFIRHDLQKKEWEAVARVLVYGYQNLSYFPLKLSLTFMITCLFGEESITTESLLASFRKYIASEDREVSLYNVIQIIQYFLKVPISCFNSGTLHLPAAVSESKQDMKLSGNPFKPLPSGLNIRILSIEECVYQFAMDWFRKSITQCQRKTVVTMYVSY